MVYAGQPLASRQRCHWRVTVWSRDGRSAARADSWWEMGLLEPGDWRATWIGWLAEDPPDLRARLEGASWIGCPDGDSGRRSAGEHGRCCFRLPFELPPDWTRPSGDLLVSSHHQCEVRVNGAALPEHELRAVEHPRVFQLALDGLLRPGPNLLAVAVPEPRHLGGLLAQLEVRGPAGDAVHLASGGEWRARRDPGDDWAEPGAADEGWTAAEVLGRYGDEPGLVLPLPSRPAPCTYLQRPFAVDGSVRRARLYATARGCYELVLNGRRVGDERLAPGWTDYRVRRHYQGHDVTDLVRPGENVLGAILGDGWYAGAIGWNAERHHYGPYPLGLLAQLELEHADGRRELVVSDGSWRAASGPIRSSDMLMGEVHDARLERDGWCEPGGGGADWEPARELPPEGARLLAQPCEPVRVTERLPARGMTEPEPGVYVFDLGQNIVGWARLRARCPAGTELQLRFGEVLDADGRLYTANLRTARSTDRYTTRGALPGEAPSEAEEYEPRFTFHGFRYVELRGHPGRPAPDAVEGVVVHSDFPRTGRFECSSALVNRLQQNVVWSLRGNFLSVPTDCPQRDERLGWLGDAQLFAPAACYNANAAAFLAKWLADLRDAQSPQGAYPDVAPSLVVRGEGSPAWADAGVIVPWVAYVHYGDGGLLERHYGSIRRWMAWVHDANPDGLWRWRAGSNFGDWVAPDPGTPRLLLATAYLAHTTGLAARIADALGRGGDGRAYRRLSERAAAAFRREFVAPDGRVESGTQTAYALALRFGLLPPELRPAAARRLAAAVEERGGRLSTGFVGTAHLLHALAEHGQLELAYRVLLNEEYPSWGHTIRRGATTIWERWDGDTEERGFAPPDMNSFNHYALGSVGAWLYEHVAGLAPDPGRPGWEHVIVRPRPGGGLTWARAAVDGVRGRVESAWERGDTRFELTVAIPACSEATVHMPAAPDRPMLESDEPVERADGVRVLRREPDRVVLAVAPGRYRFASELER